MDAKSLTENGWKATALKFKVKDNGLQRALATYEKLENEKHAERLKALAAVSQFAGALKKIKEVAANSDVVEYLGDVLTAAEINRKQIEVAAAAVAKASAEAKKKEMEKQKEGEDEEADDGDYPARLTAALLKLKSSKDLAYEFIVCDAKPHCGVMVAKRINAKHKEELTKLTGGSKRFLHPGTCRFDNGHLVFAMEQPVTGLARKLQDSIKNFTGKKFPILVGAESAEEDGNGQPAAAQSAAHIRPEPPTLSKAPELWHQTRNAIATNLNEIKTAIRKEFAGAGQDLVADIEKNMTQLDGIIEKLDHRLADSMARAHEAKDAAARKIELDRSKTILAEYIKYVKSEPMIAHLDSNPFGIQINLKQRLTESLTHMAQAIG